MIRTITALQIRIKAEVTIICLHPLIFVQIKEQSHIPEDSQVIELTTREWAIDPGNITCDNDQGNFVPQPWAMKLMAEPNRGHRF